MKTKWKTEDALNAAQSVIDRLKAACLKVEVVYPNASNGKDCDRVEIVYRPIFQSRRVGVFGRAMINLADENIGFMERNNLLQRRKDGKGLVHWGPINKDATHVASGVPVNLRMATK